MTLRLPRIRGDIQLISNGGLPSRAFVTAFNNALAQIEDAFNGSAEALEAAETAQVNDARSSSYTVPTNVLTGSDAGSDASIAIAGHIRVYPGRVDKTVDAGSLTGLAYSTAYFVYYDDPDLAGGAVTFVATTVQKDSQVGAAAGRHFVGTVTTPAGGGGASSGTGTYPPGGGGGTAIP